MQNQPLAFLPSPAGPRIEPTPAQGWTPAQQIPAVLPADVIIRAHPTRPGFAVATLAKSVLTRACLAYEGPVDLVAPARNSGHPWHLDARATARHRLPKYGKVARFNIPLPARGHFLIPAVDARPGQFGGARGSAGYREALQFALGKEVPGHPGYFELLPVR